MQFDFSDHMVLSMVQYIVPCLLELEYLSHRYRQCSETVKAFSAIGSMRSSYQEHKQKHDYSSVQLDELKDETDKNEEMLDHYKAFKSLIVLPIAAVLCLIFLNLRSLLFTSLFFHTPLENLFGYLLAVLGLLVLYAYPVSQLWFALSST